MGEILRCFISWNHSDFEETGWGKELVRMLKKSLVDALKKSMVARGYEDVDIYLDIDRDRSGAWTENQDDAVRMSHIFIPIITCRYFESDECRKELALYRVAHPDNQAARVIPLCAGPQPGRNRAREDTAGLDEEPPEVFIARRTPIKFVLLTEGIQWRSFIQEIVTEIERWDADHGLAADARGEKYRLGQCLSGTMLDRVHPWIGDDTLCLWVARDTGPHVTGPEEISDALPNVLSVDGTRLAVLMDGHVVVFVREPDDSWTSRTLRLPAMDQRSPMLPVTLLAIAPDDPIRVLAHVEDDLWLLSEKSPEWITAMGSERIHAVLGGPTDVLVWNDRWYVAEDCSWDEPQRDLHIGCADALVARLADEEFRMVTYTSEDPPSFSQLSFTRRDGLRLLATQTVKDLLGIEALSGDVRLAFGHGSSKSKDSVLLQYGDAGQVAALTWTIHGLVG